MWLFIACLIFGLAYFGTRAGVEVGLFFVDLNMLLMWILSPLAGAAIAVYAAITNFKTVSASILGILFIFALAAAVNGQGAGRILLLVAQSVAIFVGARIGRSLGGQLQ